MERLAGLRFFERTTRAVTITDAGEIAWEHAARILAEIDSVQCSLEEQRGGLVRRVRVSAPHFLGKYALGPIIGEFLAEHPGCDVTLDLSNRRVDLIEERFDFVVRVGTLEDRDLIIRHLGEVGAGLYQRPNVAGANGRLLRHPVHLDGCDAGFLRSDNFRRPILNLINQQGERAACAVRARITALNSWVLSEAAQQSHIFVVLPRFVGEPLIATKTLEPVLPHWSAVEAPASILFSSKEHLRPAARACIDFVAERLKPLL